MHNGSSSSSGPPFQWTQIYAGLNARLTTIRLQFCLLSFLLIVFVLMTYFYICLFDVSGKVAFVPAKQISQNETGNGTITINWNDTRLDILHMPRIQFSKKFKNPCWYERLSEPNPYRTNVYRYSSAARKTFLELRQEWENRLRGRRYIRRLRCLPYFLIIGQPKCGSTDLFWKISRHPDVATPPVKGLHWWSRNRQGRRFLYTQIIPFDNYIDLFDKAALRIQRETSSDLSLKGKPDFHPVITGEGSVSLLWDNSDWWQFPENRALVEPVYTNSDYIYHMIPQVKLLLILRDPTERLYSDYLYFTEFNKSADDFHLAVNQAIQVYTDCQKRSTIRGCVFNNTASNRVRVRLRIGTYSVYLHDWMKVFPREQFLVLRLEDYSENQQRIMDHVFAFLGLRELSVSERRRVFDQSVYNKRKEEDQKLGGMHSETRQLLDQFYRPFNEELRNILDDDRFLWRDSSR